ncbi:hypothetical protein BaRGS_00040162 [Batillaria attramentaria]|uniref:Fucosyltransferase n=1 Tax=Batillaria attramentaria TaxID=370345 RepID=A0ABD0J183_9CAEN
MRRYTLKVLKVFAATFLLFVIYLNISLTDLVSDPIPWGDDYRQGWPHPPLSFSGKRVHDHNVNSSSRDEGLPIYPSISRYSEDRIVNQIHFVSQDVQEKQQRGESIPLKKILVESGRSSWKLPAGQELFVQQNCSTQACELTDYRHATQNADVVVFTDTLFLKSYPRSPDQIWALFMLESPLYTPDFRSYRSAFNWTATYRHDSTIVTPYEKFVPLNPSLLTRTPTRNYAAGKRRKVAWFVSNCYALNNRMEYARELGQYIQVDVYGDCGTFQCSRHQSDECFNMLNRDYKFYLSFENSNCRDYITEKFFINGLKNDVVPIVMGAAPEDYKRAAPPHSFIHVDYFQSPKHLAAYLHQLDHNDSLYNEYFAWKGLWDNINTYFWCRVCALAHDTKSRGVSWYRDVETWWRGGDVCIEKSWREVPSVQEQIADLAVTLRRG